MKQSGYTRPLTGFLLLSASLWWINGLCLIGALALYFMQFDENVYPFLPLALAAQCLVDSIAALRRRRS